MKLLFARLLPVLCFLVLSGTAFADTVFTARLTGAQELPAVATAATGSVACEFASGGLLIHVTVTGLSGPITAGHIHLGAPGVAGSVVRDLGFVGNTATTTWKPTDPQPLTAAMIENLFEGNLYVNVHTPANPAGEIRGQLEQAHGAHFTAVFSGTQENPPLANSSAGTGSATWTDQGLAYKITLNGLSGAITAAHIHEGPIGVNGGVLVNLGSSFTGNTASGFIPRSSFTSAQVASLFRGGLYFNAHTAAQPGGETRGQILLDGGMGFSGALTGANEVPPNGSTASATASFTLTPVGLQFDVTYTGLGALTGAHFHNAAAGVNGPVVRNIQPDVTGTTATGIWRFDDAQPLTTALLAELLAGRVYINFHTSAFPGGEIRSQVLLNDSSVGTTFTARLSADQEEPPTGVGARGTGNFVLTATGLSYRITVDGLSGGITAAHFHNAPIGVNGGVLFPVPFAGNTASGTWALSAADVTQLLLGNIYANVHTAANPGGEIRGQLVPASGAELDAGLTAAQEVPATGSAGQGTGSFRLTRDGLTFHFTSDGLTGAITASHFHAGARGIGGGVIRGIAPGEFSGTTGAGVWKPSDAAPLTPAVLVDLLRGRVYLNMHTAANPGGEIRGQVIIAGGHGQCAALTSANEIPPSGTDGAGVMGGTLTDLGLVFRSTFNDLSSAMTAAHFHNAGPSVNGPVVRTLTTDFSAGTADGVWLPSDPQPLSTALVSEILLGNMYENVHTANFGGGEIRGNFCEFGPAAVGDPIIAGNALRLSNSPNPAAQSTVLSFFLPEARNVSLKVYDIAGREVSTLMQGRSEAGEHTAVFDAGRLSNGVYLYKLQAGDQSLTRKMLVVH